MKKITMIILALFLIVSKGYAEDVSDSSSGDGGVVSSITAPVAVPNLSGSLDKMRINTSKPGVNAIPSSIVDPLSAMGVTKATPGEVEGKESVTKTTLGRGQSPVTMDGQLINENYRIQGKTLRYGHDFFKPSRDRILSLERRLVSGEAKLPTLEQRDALGSFVGSLEMISSSVYAPVPDRYVLSPGDRITATFWGATTNMQVHSLAVAPDGTVSLPQAGSIVARGMTVDQLQVALQKILRLKTDKYLQIIVTLDRLKSIQVFVTGEAFRPGSYAVSAVTTLFGALQACGGPTERGSLRTIRLVRGQKTITVDFYEYLLHGDGKNDIPLMPGDTIYLPSAERFVGVTGEVQEPGIYELTANENLKGLLSLARGFTPVALLNKVLVATVKKNTEYRMADLDLTDPQFKDFPLVDGDKVTVQAISPGALNQVTLLGAVEHPGTFELKPNMRLADLFSPTNKPLGGAFQSRVNIVRFNKDKKTTALLQADLGKALSGDADQNIVLAPLDQVVVYARWEAAYEKRRAVYLDGAVQRPGEYVRSDGMRLSDLLFSAGGVTPNAVPDIEIFHVTPRGEVLNTLISRENFSSGKMEFNPLIDDEDVVTVRSLTEYIHEPKHIRVTGEVKYAGAFPKLNRGERLSSILKRAGGLTTLAWPRGAIFMRAPENLTSDEQDKTVKRIDKLVNFLNPSIYAQKVARNQLLLLKEAGADNLKNQILGNTGSVVSSGSTPKEAAAVGLAPTIANSMTAAADKALGAYSPLPSSTTPARQLAAADLKADSRVIIDLERVLANPGSQDDIEVRDGDTLYIPKQPSTVSLVGAVTKPITIAFGAKSNLDDYLRVAGGLAPDGDKDRIMVVRTNGIVEAGYQKKWYGDSSVSVEPGDVIYVAPNVTGADIIERTDKLVDAFKYFVTTAAGVAAFLGLLAMF